MWSGYDSKLHGLCATCKFAEECVLRDKRGQDALYCELYERRASESSAGKEPEGGAGDNHPLQALGLCATCANAGTCRLARSEAGVWHCEEYA